MRLGNRTMNWAEAGRRLWGDRKDQPQGLQSQERTLLMTPDTVASDTVLVAEAAPPSASPETNSLLNGDPTQQLLTALGRFQRQVNVADSGAPAEAWVDNCMDQLITGIQIAHVRGWKGVKEALTDTARVLQSYDDAGAASGSVAFLQDAYEILCLMVGDLLVDNMRSGVMQKWRERYARAVSDLEKAGHSLLDDDGNAVSTTVSRAPEPAPVAAPVAATPPMPAARPNNVTPFVPRAAYEEPLLEEEAAAPLNESYADLDTPDVTYVTDEEEYAEDQVEYTDAGNYIVIEEEQEATPFDDQIIRDEPATLEVAFEVETLDVPELGTESDPFAALQAEVEAYEAELEVEAPEEDDVEEVHEESAVITDDVELVEEESDEYSAAIEIAAVHDEEDEAVLEPEAWTDQLDEDESESLFAVPETAEDSLLLEDEGDDSEAFEEEAVPAESPRVETAEFLFDEMAQEAEESTFLLEPADAETSMLESEEELTDEMAQETLESADNETVVESVEESPQMLLRNAQAAMLRGDTRDAKLIALQLAANMARLEAQIAVQVVQEAIARLSETEESIAIAEADVAAAEQRLAETMEQRGSREHDLDVKTSGIAGLEKRAGSVESAIAKLDEQIAKLQAQREAEYEKLTEVQSELEAERGEEHILLEDLDRIQEAERAAGDTLDLARGRVQDLRAQRLERDQAREACEQLLARQRESAENIERTLEAVQG